MFVTWRALLGDYPATQALRQGRVTSSELALMTFLMARSRSVPLRLIRPSLEAAIAAADPQHLLACPLTVSDLVTDAL
jgi:hypothetical protein